MFSSGSAAVQLSGGKKMKVGVKRRKCDKSIKSKEKCIISLDKVYTVVYTNGKEAIIMIMAKLITNGGSQAVRLPREMRFEGTEVCASRHGDMVILTPKDKQLDIFLEGISEFTDDYFETMDNRPKFTESKRETL